MFQRVNHFDGFGDGGIDGDEGWFWLGAELEFDVAGGERLFADGNSDGDANQIGVFEFHARAFVAVIQQNLNALIFQFAVNFVSRLNDFGVILID